MMIEICLSPALLDAYRQRVNSYRQPIEGNIPPTHALTHAARDHKQQKDQDRERERKRRRRGLEEERGREE